MREFAPAYFQMEAKTLAPVTFERLASRTNRMTKRRQILTGDNAVDILTILVRGPIKLSDAVTPFMRLKVGGLARTLESSVAGSQDDLNRAFSACGNAASVSRGAAPGY